MGTGWRERLLGFDGLSLLCVVCLSLAFVLATYGIHFVLGDSGFWLLETEDVTQYVSGFNMYLSAPWSYPLLAFDSLNYPEGTRATFVDAVPAYAFLLKLFLPKAIGYFNPFGYWVTLCFILQGVAAWWIARELQVRSWVFLISLCVLLITFPALLYRLGHISLMSHWLLLFAVACYLRSCRCKVLSHCWIWLVPLAFYINIYIFVMISGVYLAAIARVDAHKRLRSLLLAILPFGLLFVSLFIFLFPMSSGAVGTDTGFGVYSMNLISPFMGGRFIELSSKVTSEQMEGFNYLGLGVILALLVSLLAAPRDWLATLRRHWPLLAILFIYAFYSLSNRIYAGESLIATVNYPGFLQGLVTQFRVSGRFFWLVGYVLAIFALYRLYKGTRPQVFVCLAIMMVAIQILDLKPIYKQTRERAAVAYHPVIDVDSWNSALRGANVLYFYPKFRCGGEAYSNLLPLMGYAARHELKLNTGYISRYNPRCDDVQQEIDESDTSRSAYVFMKRDYPDEVALNAMVSRHGVTCREVQFAFVCRK